jgi:hypothetical protein
MLDELLRAGLVEKISAGSFKILKRAYVPESLHADALERLGGVIKNFVTTVEVNTEKSAPGSGRFERVVFADNGLKLELLPSFERLLRTKVQQLLVELDNWLGAQEPTDASENNSLGTVRTDVGIYHFIEED